jgi:hypothetical protein
MWTRRQFLLTAGGAGVGVAMGAVRVAHADGVPSGVTVTAQTGPPGSYLYLPFDVPHGVNRLDVAATKSVAGAKTGIGLFDHRGPGYQSPGFRGIYGEERAAFHVASDSASEAFLPGPIVPGEWTVIVPVFPGPSTEITVDVQFSYGPQRPARRIEPAPDVVIRRPGWYRGDLHAHTPHSSDAWSSRSALTSRMWAQAAAEMGLDFVAVTDHNVVSQNLQLRSDSKGLDVLLLAGEEMTNWFHGHATVSGIDPGDWLDWRQTPAGLPLPTGQPGARVTDFLRDARALGGFVSAAHPFAAHLSWQFLAEGIADPAAMPDALEVWTGQWQPDDEAALRAWDALLMRGVRIAANGGSDMHGLNNSEALLPGTPTTVVCASSLSRAAVLDALRQGCCFVQRAPDAAEVHLSATGPDGQRAIVGGTVHGGSGDPIELAARVRGGAGMRLSFVVGGVPMPPTLIGSDDEVVKTTVPVGTAAYVRAELRSDIAMFQHGHELRSSRADMECFTNPVWLEVGEPQPSTRSDVPPPPPRREAVTQRQMLERFGMGPGSGVPVSSSRCAACHGHDHG